MMTMFKDASSEHIWYMEHTTDNLGLLFWASFFSARARFVLSVNFVSSCCFVIFFFKDSFVFVRIDMEIHMYGRKLTLDIWLMWTIN